MSGDPTHLPPWLREMESQVQQSKTPKMDGGAAGQHVPGTGPQPRLIYSKWEQKKP